jgi:4a-hydroxytetrahydrobiopterin dehydratase
MSTCNIADLRKKKCVPCEGGVPPVPLEQAREILKGLPEWKLSDDGIRIRREWKVKNFMAGMEFFHRVAELAEDEGHHPDLHLVGYRNVAIELWTHAIGGLSENDFITAAKIDLLPIEIQ